MTCGTRCGRFGATILVLGLWIPVLGWAEGLVPGERSGDPRLEVEPIGPRPERDEPPILPPYPIPHDSPFEGLMSDLRVRVREVMIDGNSVIPDDALRRIASSYENRALAYEDLLELRDRLTLLYVDAGYLTSGAVLPKQTIRDGVVRFVIVEGRLSEIEIETDGHFRESTLRGRLRTNVDGPVNIHDLEGRLRALQQDRRIERIEAHLLPDHAAGTSTLQVLVYERAPYSIGADFDNYRSSSIGSLGGQLHGRVDNLAGIGDTFFARAGFSEGLVQLDGKLEIPVSPWETLLTLRYLWSDAEIVSEPIASSLDIETRSRTISAELRQPLWRTPSTTFETYLRGELRRSDTYLDGTAAPLAEGSEDGVSKVTVLRFGLEWTQRTRLQAIALRSLITIGIPILDATHNPNGTADGEFVAWLAQAQWARRLPGSLDAELIVRGDLQLANSALLPLEQFSIGGRYSVRGYRENTLVRDNGLIGSIETRIPLYRRVRPALRFDVIPFLDVGHSWSTNRQEIGKQTLMSIGLGTRLDWSRWAGLELYWGHRLRDVDRIGERDLQDSSVHFRVFARWP